jgi:hypothetical protein
MYLVRVRILVSIGVGRNEGGVTKYVIVLELELL